MTELLEMAEQEDKQKHYNNEELIEKLYQSFLRYPIRKVPPKERTGVILSKIIGKIKRRDFFGKRKLLPEPNIISCNKHTDFVNRISDLERYKENETIEQEDYRVAFNKGGMDIDHESSR